MSMFGMSNSWTIVRSCSFPFRMSGTFILPAVAADSIGPKTALCSPQLHYFSKNVLNFFSDQLICGLFSPKTAFCSPQLHYFSKNVSNFFSGQFHCGLCTPRIQVIHIYVLIQPLPAHKKKRTALRLADSASSPNTMTTCLCPLRGFVQIIFSISFMYSV